LREVRSEKEEEICDLNTKLMHEERPAVFEISVIYFKYLAKTRKILKVCFGKNVKKLLTVQIFATSMLLSKKITNLIVDKKK
jgi:hypothetical protein